MKAQWKRIAAMLADFKPEDRVTVPVGPLLWANEEIEQLRVDAERYRWLRKQHWAESDIAVVVSPKKHTRLGAILPSLELLDKTIDHMMKEPS